jgi:hypothetical protein
MTPAQVWVLAGWHRAPQQGPQQGTTSDLMNLASMSLQGG